jgi:hypothetical protein
MYSTPGDCAKELWAVVDELGCIKWSRGGSSTAARLMVYDNEASAHRALKSPWIKQIIDPALVTVKLIYKV